MSPLEPQTPTSSEPPSTPRNSVGTNHDTDNDDRENDSVFVDNASDVWESRPSKLTARTIESESLDTGKIQNAEQLDSKYALQKLSANTGEDKKQTRVVAYRSPIHSDM